MPRSSAQCPMCPKIVEIKFSTERLIVHDNPQGVECAGSELRVAAYEPAPAEWKPTQSRKKKGGRVVPPAPPEKPLTLPQVPRRKPESKGGSVWAVSAGLPGLGKRR